MKSELYKVGNDFSRFSLGFNRSEEMGSSLLNGLLWYYELEEASGTRFDSGDNGFNLSETGLVGQAAGILDNAADFPGVAANKLSKSYESQFDFSATDFTWTGWMYLDALESRFQVYLGTAGNAAADKTITISTNAGSACVRPSISDGVTSPSMDLQIAGGLPTSQWFFWVIRYNNVTGLLEGRLDNEPWSSVSAMNPPHHIGTETLTLGMTTNDASPFNGRLDEVGAWNRLLSDTEVDYLYNAGIGNRPGFVSIPPQNVVNGDSTLVTNKESDQVTT